ncbi:manganese transporter [Paenibacillus sp. PK3_47]|uniref:metal ABC transporter solute-binding protein, Zn/Mn family n=1 Tax=Paenibacillus sp. PK3_47 TaxID=2072642 RepID=UPI00201E6CBC|nr:zinc ABC transporter substrate-binding protein [Paenibacillus sp. PK3_47]UQZ36675.1 manganese transporter [Paenibacillus sp. PK3_47]
MRQQRMGRTRTLKAAALLGLTLLVTACGTNTNGNGDAAAGSGDNRITIVTTISQIADPISVIGGDKVDVLSLMGPGVDPHLYNATQGDIAKLDRADLVLYSGLHLEGQMNEVFEEIGKTRPTLAISESIPEEELLKDEQGDIDPHVWFDMDLWKQALDNATEELKQLSPEDAQYFDDNRSAYFAQLDTLNAESKAKLAEIPEGKRTLVTAHDAFGYFGRANGIDVVGLQGLSTEDEIGVSDINDTISLLTQYNIPAVFVESSINPKSIEAVIEGAKSKGLEVKVGGELFSDAMGEAGTPEGTYLGMYKHNVETIYAALSGGGE